MSLASQNWIEAFSMVIRFSLVSLRYEPMSSISQNQTKAFSVIRYPPLKSLKRLFRQVFLIHFFCSFFRPIRIRWKVFLNAATKNPFILISTLHLKPLKNPEDFGGKKDFFFFEKTKQMAVLRSAKDEIQ